MAWLDSPAADSNTIFTRRTNACGILRERASASNCSRSSAVNTTTRFGLPIVHPLLLKIHEIQVLIKLFMGHYTSADERKRRGFEREVEQPAPQRRRVVVMPL